MKMGASAVRAICVLLQVCLMPWTSVGLPPGDRGQMSSDDPAPWLCPDQCECSKSGASVNCEGKRLTTMPKGIPPVVEILRLDHNNFKSLLENSFANFTHLTKVYLRNSQIQTIQAGAFRNLTLLKELYLTNNKIAKLTTESFQGVMSLSLLNLQANLMKTVPDLPTLVGLKKLYLEANQIENATFPKGYGSLQSLNDIVLSNNNITQLTNDTFEALGNLTVRRLEITRNGLKSVSSGALRPLRFLQSLKIGLNPLDGQQLQNVLEGLREISNLGSLDIHGIALGGTLPSVSFSILSNTRLSVLIFNHNKVRKIPARAFAHLPKLVQLDLSACHVEQVADNAFVDLPELQTLFLSDNPLLTSVPKNLPGNLQKLYLQGDGIQALGDSDFAQLTQLRELYLSKNQIHEVAENSFTGLMNLHILHIQSNKLSYIPKKLFYPLANLRTLNLKNNILVSLKPNPGVMSSLAALTSLDMSGNQCSFIPFDFFTGLSNLQTLNLDDNNLGGLMAADVTGHLLSQLRKLQRLSVANNNLHYIHDAQFRNLNELQQAILNNNQLSSWGPGLFNTTGTAKKTLKTVDLSGNQIALVNKTSVQHLQKLQMLNLTSNPFACTCDLRWFRAWLNRTTVEVANVTLYKCNSPAAWNGKALLDFGPDKIDCTDYTWYYVGAAIGGTFVLALVVFSGLYHRRWFIRLKVYRLKVAIGRKCCGSGGGVRNGRRHGYEPLEGQNAPGKMYDFYVIYAEEDTRWVSDNLLPMLDNHPIAGDPEQRYPGRFSLYFEERDARAGKVRVASFNDDIYACRGVLVVLKQNLKRDKWCEFLLEQVYQLNIDGEIDSIQIIKVGNVPLRHVPRRLHSALEKNEYREWPNRENMEQEFANFLENSLQQAQGRNYGAATAPRA